MTQTSNTSGKLELSAPEQFWVDAYVSRENCRIRVLDYRGPDFAAMRQALETEARKRDLGKVFLKARGPDGPELTRAGFEQEAVIEGYFNGTDAVVVSLFLDPARRQRSASKEEQEGLRALCQAPVPQRDLVLPEDYQCTVATADDAPELAQLYKEVFASYPFPIFASEYLIQTMESHIVYRVIRDGSGQMVAAASGETVPNLFNAEMTDFATLPSQRGKRLALYLLQELEKDMAQRKIFNLYTLARSSMMGMNKVFHHLGYHYTGTLVKNCHIGGAFEDMVCWCKRLPS